MKGNDGRGAHKKKNQRLLGCLALLINLIAIYFLYMQYYSSVTKYVGRDHHHHRHRREGHQSSGVLSLLEKRTGDNKIPSLHDYKKNIYSSLDKNMQKIVDAEYNLIDISNSGTMGSFCRVNFAVHKASPSRVPMFRDIVAKSPGCETPFITNLKSIADEARLYDEVIRIHESTAVAGVAAATTTLPKVLDVSGVVFHESRCGSTLVANTLIAVNPVKHRVYSESSPPLNALEQMVRGDKVDNGNKEDTESIVQNVIYLMSRSNDSKEERVFFKIQSIGSWKIPIFRAAFPSIPWLYVYRNPVQVMTSHFQKGIKKAHCLQYYQRYGKTPSYITNVIERYSNGAKNAILNMSHEEFCASHLASLTEVALHEIKESDGVGNAINYADLPDIMYKTILPAWLNVPKLSEEEKDNIIDVSGVYSKERNNEKHEHEWKDDTERKESIITPEMIKAAKKFMNPSFEGLEGWKARI